MASAGAKRVPRNRRSSDGGKARGRRRTARRRGWSPGRSIANRSDSELHSRINAYGEGYAEGDDVCRRRCARGRLRGGIARRRSHRRCLRARRVPGPPIDIARSRQACLNALIGPIDQREERVTPGRGGGARRKNGCSKVRSYTRRFTCHAPGPICRAQVSVTACPHKNQRKSRGKAHAASGRRRPARRQRGT